MHFSENEKTTYLFCASLPQTKTIPLTIIEWNAAVKSLAQQNLDPTYLLDSSPSDLLNLLTEATDSQKMNIIKKVEARKKLGFGILELEELYHNGYNIVFRSDYPNRFKKLELKQRPPFYHYIGDLNILHSPQVLGVVGSREASKEELQSIASIATDATQRGITIVSGGARGVDSVAVETALQNGGRAIIFPTEGLVNWSRKKEYRKYIQNGQVLILSVQPIKSKFTGAYAMQRNKFIHSTGDATLVASSLISGKKKSGTWEGVVENIKAQWSPLYVIGESEGVEKLKEMNVATTFTSLNDIFKPDTKQLLANLQHHFTDLLSKAKKFSLSTDEINDAFQKSFECVFSKVIVGEEKSLINSEESGLKTTEDEKHINVSTNKMDALDETEISMEINIDSVNKGICQDESETFKEKQMTIFDFKDI